MANFCAVAGMKRVHECLEKTDSISSLEAKKVLKVGVNENVDSDESLISAQDKSAECSEQCNTGKVLPHKAFIKMASNGDSAAEFENSADQNSPEGWEMPGEFRCLEEDHRSGVVECDCIAPPLTGPVFAGHNTQPHQKFRKLVLAQKEWKSLEIRKKLGEIGKKKAKVLGANDLRHIALVFGYKSKHFKSSAHQAETPLADGVFSEEIKEKLAESPGNQTESTKTSANTLIRMTVNSSEHTETNCLSSDSEQQIKNESLQSKRHDEKSDESEEERLRKIAEQVGMNLLDFAKGKATNYNVLEILSGFSKASEAESRARGNSENVSGFKPWNSAAKAPEADCPRAATLPCSQFTESKNTKKQSMMVPLDFWSTLHKPQLQVSTAMTHPMMPLPAPNNWMSPQATQSYLWNLQSAAQKIIEAQSISAFDFSTLSSMSMASQMKMHSPSSNFTGRWMGNQYPNQKGCYTNGCSISSTDLQSS